MYTAYSSSKPSPQVIASVTITILFTLSCALASLAHAQDSFILPTSEEYRAMTDDEKLELFVAYKQLSSEDQAAVEKQVQALPVEDAGMFASEYIRIMELAQERKTQSDAAADQSSPQPEVSIPAPQGPDTALSPSLNAASLMVVSLALFAVLGASIVYRRRKQTLPETPSVLPQE